MAERYQSRAKKSTKNFEVLGRKELAVSMPLPLGEVREELQLEVEHLTGLAGLKIIRAAEFGLRPWVAFFLRTGSADCNIAMIVQRPEPGAKPCLTLLNLIEG